VIALVWPDGQYIPLPVRRWFGRVTPEEARLLRRARGPVLDVGCGPGRHVVHRLGNGTAALGIDVSPAAARIATRRGAAVIRRSVFDPLPGEGSWRSVLLLDGNIGIGGDPETLLTRVRTLVHPTGSVFVEFDQPGTPAAGSLARMSRADGLGPAFPWSRLAIDHGIRLAGHLGYAVREAWLAGDRWFAELRHAESGAIGSGTRDEPILSASRA